jgi:hypothetical protein
MRRVMSRSRISEASPAGIARIVVAMAIGVALMPTLMLVDWRSSEESRAFVRQPQFVLWILVLCGQAAIWGRSCWSGRRCAGAGATCAGAAPSRAGPPWRP